MKETSLKQQQHWYGATQRWKVHFAGLLLGAMLAYSGGAALSQSGLALSWWTLDSGGTVASTSGGYTLNGTIGQADAHDLHAGDLTLHGGFWSDSSATATAAKWFYLPLVSKP